MKFGDKLVELRKKNGYSQEELAEKLGVSRQSVSKWESNNTYPETDKIVQIANIFDCSMDDLINDKITDVETTLRKNKNNIYNIWDSLLDFITKSINMFSRMNFSTGFKCIIEMIILGFLLGLFGHIVCSILSELISNIFSFISHNIVFLIKQILYGVFSLIWFIIGAIVVIHTFKIRYLNYYDETAINNLNKSDEKEKNDNINNNKSDEKVIIRDEKDKPFAFLSTLSKIVIIFIKFMAFWFLIGVVATAVGFVVGVVLSLAYIPTHIIFLWIFLMLTACSVVTIQIILLLINFIFNRKTNSKRHIIVFICGIVVFGLGIGMTLLTFKNIELINDNSQFKFETKEISLNYKDDLAIVSNGLGVSNEYKYIIDNSIEGNNIIVSRNIDPKFFELYNYETQMDMMPIITIQEDSKDDFRLYYDFIIKNLKKNKIYTFSDYGNDPLIIRANEDTINKLINNLKKLYLISEENKENTIDITIVEEKVYFRYGVEGSYDAINDSIIYNENIEDYSCKKEIENTKYGDKFIYICDYTER